jgi:hypothetical protein
MNWVTVNGGTSSPNLSMSLFSRRPMGGHRCHVRADGNCRSALRLNATHGIAYVKHSGMVTVTDQKSDATEFPRLIENRIREDLQEGRPITETAAFLADFITVAARHLAEGLDVAGELAGNSMIVQSVVSNNSGDPYVQCRVGGFRWQWTPEEARQHAHQVLASAEAATHDAAMVRWMTLGGLAVSRETALQSLGDLRRFRGDVEREFWDGENADQHDGR